MEGPYLSNPDSWNKGKGEIIIQGSFVYSNWVLDDLRTGIVKEILICIGNEGNMEC